MMVKWRKNDHSLCKLYLYTDLRFPVLIISTGLLVEARIKNHKCGSKRDLPPNASKSLIGKVDGRNEKLLGRVED